MTNPNVPDKKIKSVTAFAGAQADGMRHFAPLLTSWIIAPKMGH